MRLLLKKAITSAVKVSGKDRNAVKNISWAIQQDKHLPEALVKNEVKVTYNLLASGTVCFISKPILLCK